MSIPDSFKERDAKIAAIEANVERYDALVQRTATAIREAMLQIREASIGKLALTGQVVTREMIAEQGGLSAAIRKSWAENPPANREVCRVADEMTPILDVLVRRDYVLLRQPDDRRVGALEVISQAAAALQMSAVPALRSVRQAIDASSHRQIAAIDHAINVCDVLLRQLLAEVDAHERERAKAWETGESHPLTKQLAAIDAELRAIKARRDAANADADRKARQRIA